MSTLGWIDASKAHLRFSSQLSAGKALKGPAVSAAQDKLTGKPVNKVSNLIINKLLKLPIRPRAC